MVRLAGVAAAALVFTFSDAAALAQPVQRREFLAGVPRRIEDLPASRLRTQLERLPIHAKDRAAAWLSRFHFTDLDLNSLQVDREGGIFYADSFTLPLPAAAESSEPPIAAASVSLTPFPTGLIFHSRPGAPNVLFLNFSGENVTDTAWNSTLSRTVIPAVAFSIDSDFSTFSDTEQTAIKRVWQRVAEDYAPFDIDVTTERPASFGNRTGHALITRHTDADGQPNPSSGGGGVAYVDVFADHDYANHRPAWIYSNHVANDESNIAEAVSHEFGHNLGLSHDGKTDSIAGTNAFEYYVGHGSGDTSWGPIMGTGYGRNVSQWSKGEYYLASNPEDDLAIIAGKTTYRADDHGDTAASATALIITAGTNVVATTPENDPANANPNNKGVLERDIDVDVFSFVTGSGAISLTVNPWIMPSGTRGGNLDVRAELYDSAGTLLQTADSSSQTFARIQTTLTGGNYYLHVRNAGAGDPMNSPPSGYTSYGSLGQYFVSGYVAPYGVVIPPAAALLVTDVTLPGAGSKQFTVAYSDNVAVDVSTIDNQDVRITGPGGYDRPGRLISINIPSNGTPRVATYAADPPAGGVWTESDDGAYTIWMQANQVSDTAGEYVAAQQLGQFNVNVPMVIYAANMDANPGWTLEPLWQYGEPSYSGTGPAAGFTGTNIVAYNLEENYENNLSTTYATTPPINCAGFSSVTLRFWRWLGLRSGDTALIQVSTNGTVWADVWSTTQTISDNSWQEMQYALPVWVAGSPSVQLRWSIASNPSSSDIGWNLDDVELLGGGRLDFTPPIATLNVVSRTSSGSSSHSFTVTFTDDSAVRVASLGNSDLVVTGPNGYSNLVAFAGVDIASDGTRRTATYSAPVPGAAWDAADNGYYLITLQEGEVTDTLNNAMAETELGGFDVSIPIIPQTLVVGPTELMVLEGSNAVFTVRLAAPPAADVTVTVARLSGDSDLSITSGATNVFTPLNWSNAVPVTLAALTDSDQGAGTAVFECRSDGLAPVTVLATEQDTTPDVVLTVSVNNPAWGTVNPAGGTFVPGSAIEVTAAPSPYFKFVQWTGDHPAANNPITVVLNTNVTVQAVFDPIVTTGHATPYEWTASNGYTNDFENAELLIGANGVPLWQSYIAGLNPNDPDSQFRLTLTASADQTSRVLNWNTVTGRTYTVWASTNLVEGFTRVSGATNLPWTVQSFTNANDPISATVIYRMEVRKP